MTRGRGSALLFFFLFGATFCAASPADQPPASGGDENIRSPRAEAVAPPKATADAAALANLAHDAQQALEQGNLTLAAELHEKIAKQLGVDKPQEAILHYNQAIELHGILGQFSEQALDLNLRGNLFLAMNDTAEARATFQEAQVKAAQSGNKIYQAASTNNLGLLEEGQGNLAAARLAYEKALDQLTGLEGADETRIKMLRNLSQIYRKEGNLQEGLVLLQRARQLCPPRLGNLSGAILSDLGFHELLLKRPAAALAYFLEALDFLSHMATQEQIAFFDRLGLSLIGLQRPLEARQAFQHAITLAQSSGRSNSEIGSRINLCKLSVLFPDSESRNSGEPSCEAAKKAAQTLSDPNLLSGFYYWQARHLRNHGHLQDAIDSAKTAVDLVDSLRSRVSGRNGRSRFLEDRAFNFRYLIDLLMAAHRTDPDGGFAVQALEVGERLRARTLVELWSEAGVDLLDSASPVLRAELEQKSQKLETLLSKTKERGDQERIAEALADLDSLEQRLRESSPNYLRVVRPAPVTVAEVQRQLGAEDALVVLSLGEERSYLFAIDSNHIRSFELAPAAELEKAATSYIQLLSDPQALSHRAAFLRAGLQLARLLWGENAERLAGLPSRLIFLGDGKLQQFPISALPLLDSNPESPRYLVELFEVVHLPSFALLRQTRGTAYQAPTKKAILLGDPVYRLEARTDIRMLPLARADLERLFPGNNLPPALGRLPFADIEAERIKVRFGARAIDDALGPHAAKKLALSPEIGNYSIVHLSSHGWRDPDHSELSALMLSEVDAAGQPVDGKLRLQDLYGLRLRADLVVASACQTGIGGNLRLEGVGGLAQGFFHAGARRTLVSLWQVESESTAILMDHFYQHLLAGDPPGQALRRARLDLSALSRTLRNNWGHPFYWSAFVLIGDWNSFELPEPAASPKQSRQPSVNRPSTKFRD